MARPPQELPRQVIRLPDERLRRRAHGRVAGRHRACAPRPKARTPTWSCSTPATSARRRPRRSIPISAACEREAARAPMIAVAGCVAQAEGEEIMAPRAGGRPGGRPAGLSPPARDGRRSARAASARSTPTCRPTPSSTRCRRAAVGAERVPDHPGRLRQILHLLRGALHARRRNLAAVRRSLREARDAGRGGAREITLLGQNVNAWSDAAAAARGADPRPRRIMEWSGFATRPTHPVEMMRR